MTDTSTARAQHLRAAPATPPVGAETTPSDIWTWRHPEGRVLSGILGVGALGAGLALGGGFTPTFWAGLLGPDVAFFKGVGEPTGHGQLPRSAVPLYNALHRPEAPAVAVALGIATFSQPLVVGGLGWFAHVAIDRAFGFGLRRPDGHIH